MKTNINQVKATENLLIANQELHVPDQQRKKQARELIDDEENALKNLMNDEQRGFQKDRKNHAVVDLTIADHILPPQYKKKQSLAVKLAIANEKLHFQNKQHKKKVKELEAANYKFIHQSEINQHHAAELKEALDELESFSYSVSHDLRAPLRAISGLTQVLAEDYVAQLHDDAKELLNEVIRNSNRMGELIDNLLQFSRIGKQHFAMGEVNINQLVSAVIADQKHLEPQRTITLDIKSMENAQGDRNLLKQVFINLVSNAFKYTGKKTTAVIEMGSYHQNNDLVYYIKDNGAGFDMKYYDKLFGVFQRLHSTHEFEGTGVGLAIIQRIITKHHGKVWAEGKVDEGACFYFSLPNSIDR